MKILGIDPGTATLGWGVIEVTGQINKLLAYGEINTKKTSSASARLYEIAQDLETLIIKHRPDEAAVEELFFFKNQKTIISVAQARGVIFLTLERLGITIAEYTPLQIKQALTNYGRADKTQVQLMVKNILKLKNIPKPDDAADALAIAICHAARYRMENILDKK